MDVLHLAQLSGALGCVCLMLFGERALGLCLLSGVGTLNALSMVQQTGAIVWSVVAIASAVVCVSYLNKVAKYKPKPWLPALRAVWHWFVVGDPRWKTWRMKQ